MAGKRNSRIIAFLIIVFCIVQIISSSYTQFESINSHANNSHALFTSITNHNNILLISRENRNGYYHKTAAKTPETAESSVSFIGIFLTISLFLQKLLDNRKTIQQAIPHYFHGGKYKSVHLIIQAN